MAIRPTFMGFESATRGLMTNQKALDIVGNNLTNIGVTGYTRQRADLVSLSANSRYTRYNQNSTALAGQGVNTYGISQIRDKFLDRRFREEYSEVGYYSTTASVLNDLSASLDEVTPATLSVAFTKFQDTWDELLSASTNESTGAANLLAQASNIVQAFRQMSTKIDNVWNQQQYNMSLEVDNINKILERVAELNDAIVHQQYNSMDPTNKLYQPLELLDQRNVLLDQLAGYADIYYEDQSDGSVTVWMGAKDESNPPAVQGDKFGKLQLNVDDTDPEFKTASVIWVGTGKDVTFSTGSIRASLNMLNGRGLGASGNRGETFDQGILYFKDKIDQFSVTIANAFNAVVQEADPSTGGAYDPPRYKTLFTFDNDAYENAAGLQVNSEWEKDSAYLITNLLDKLSTEGEGSGGDNNNSYAAKAAQIFKNVLDFGEFKGTISEYISFYSVTRLGNSQDYAESCMETTGAVADDLLNQIQAISGVNMEEEGVDMMMYQKSFDAVSRLFTTLDELLDRLINATGKVGL